MGKSTLLDLPVIRNYVKAAQEVQLKPQELINQLRHLHDSRLVSKLDHRVSARALQRAAARDQAYRSRVLGILLDCKNNLVLLDRMYTAAELVAITRYGDKFPTNIKGEQRTYFDIKWGEKVPEHSVIQEAKETAEYIIEDIDKASWNLRMQIESYNLLTRPEIKF